VRKEIVPLTSLRGVAAMAVVAMHFSATMQENTTGPFPSLAPHAELAVDVFFVLSGFIMAYTYLPSFAAERGAGPYWRFLIKRAARILPLNVAISFFLVLAAFLSSFAFGTNLFPHVNLSNWPSDLATNALMLPGIGIGSSINWPAWSISVEFVAYLLFPLFLACIFNASRVLFVVTCLAASALMVALCLTSAHLTPDGMHNHPWPEPWRDIARCCGEFALGLAVYRAYQSRRFNRVFEKDTTALVIAGAIVGLIVARRPDLFVLPFLPPLVLALSLNNGWVARLMGMRFPHFLGLISFSLYLVHDNFRGLAVDLIRYLHPAPLSPALGMLLAGCCTLLIIFPAWFSYVWVEKPGRSLFRSAANLEPVPSHRPAEAPN
jgi:peptidoglycan/LPS O-acetylase OafA/YrhL